MIDVKVKCRFAHLKWKEFVKNMMTMITHGQKVVSPIFQHMLILKSLPELRKK